MAAYFQFSSSFQAATEGELVPWLGSSFYYLLRVPSWTLFILLQPGCLPGRSYAPLTEGQYEYVVS